MEMQGIHNSQNNLEKEGSRLTLPDLKKNYSNQDSVPLAQNRENEQWNRT